MNPATDMVVYVIPGTTGWISEWSGALAALAAVFSAVTALIALYVSLKQIKLNEQHNSRMVTPYLTSTTTIRNNSKFFSFSIGNHGLGPAIVKGIHMFVDGQLVNGEGGEQIVNINDLLWLNHELVLHYEMFTTGDYLPVGVEVELIRLDEIEDASSYAKEFLKRTRVVIQYESVVGEHYEFDSALSPNASPDYPTS